MSAVAPHVRDLRLPPDADQWPPELRLLLGKDAAGILAAATDIAGARLRLWTPRQVTHQPGRSTMVQYRADVTWPDRQATAETIVAATGARIPAGAAVFDDGRTRVAVWRWPIDPALPGLAAALDRRRVAALLDGLGVDGGHLQLRVRAYRPTRRAVIEATGRRGRLFLKVVRPDTVEALHHTHRTLAAQVPVPDSLGWNSEGILVLAARPGRTLRDLLRFGRSSLPPPAAIDDLLDRLPVDPGSPRRRSLVASARHHAEVIAAVQPSLRGRLDDLLGTLHARPLDSHATVAVHGDLYEAQLLVESGQITGLLDVDTTGVGHRIEDIANLGAHLSVLALVSDRPKVVRRYTDALLAHGAARFDPHDLRTRIAAAVVSLATGPFRVLEPNWPRATSRRLELAGRWLDDDRRT